MAAFARAIRRTAAALAAVGARPANRLHRNQLSTVVNQSSAAAADHQLSPFPSPPALHFAINASTDEPLIRVIDTEIRFAEEADDHDRVEETPDGFPFKIEDNPGDKSIILTRECDGEHVKVEVHMPSLVTGEDEDSATDDGDADDSEKPGQSSVPLVVTLSKKNGLGLEFSCTASPDDIAINDMAVKYPENSPIEQTAYEGPDFRDLDEKLQKAFHKYLEKRGIKPSMINFLHEYMINKDSRVDLLWLKNLKKFIEA